MTVRALYPPDDVTAAALLRLLARVSADPDREAGMVCPGCKRHPDGYALTGTPEAVDVRCEACGRVLAVVVVPGMVDEVAAACAGVTWPPPFPGRPPVPEGSPVQGHDLVPGVPGLVDVPTRATWGAWRTVPMVARLAEDLGRRGEG